jgi:glycosyltransferase involved in cell wall biosynthesis
MQELKLAGIHLTVIGSGEEEKHIKSLVSSLQLENHVDLVGYVPKDNLPDFYNRADVFVLPSISESFGQVLLEAMSSGLPIIASRVGGIPETVKHGVGGLLIEPENSGAIVAAVRTLAKDKALRTSMAAHNLKLATQSFQWSTVAQQYEKLFSDAIEESSKRTNVGS